MRVSEVQVLNRNRGTFPTRKSTGSYPSLIVDTTAKRGRLARRCGGAGRDRREGRSGPGNCPRRCGRGSGPLAVHDPGKVLLDLAISVAIGGDCLADIAQLRSEPDLFGKVASDPDGVPADRHL